MQPSGSPNVYVLNNQNGQFVRNQEDQSGLELEVEQTPPAASQNSTRVWSEQKVRTPVEFGAAGCAKLV